MRLATRIGPIELEDVTLGTASPLAECWSEGPAVLIFIRHFG